MNIRIEVNIKNKMNRYSIYSGKIKAFEVYCRQLNINVVFIIKINVADFLRLNLKKFEINKNLLRTTVLPILFNDSSCKIQ